VLSDFSSLRSRSQLAVWLLMVAFVAVTAIMIRTFLDYRGAAIALLLSRDQQVTFLSAARLRDELMKFSDALSTVARTQAIYEGDPAQQREALLQAAPVREGIFDGGVMLLNNFGQVVAAEPNLTDLVGQDWSDREYFRRMLSPTDVYFSNATDERVAGAQMVVISVPVRGADGQFTGVLAGMMRLGETTISPLYATIVRLRLGQNGSSVYVLDGNGMILFDSVDDAVGKPYTSAALPENALERKAGAVRTLDRNQNEIIASFAPVPGTAWTLVVEDDWQMTTVQTQRYLALLVMLFLISMLLLGAGVAILIYQRNQGTYAGMIGESNVQVARQIKETLLPEHVPVMPGWHLSTHYEPVPAIDGDFYDLVLLRDGRLMLVVGDINEVGIAVTTALAVTRATLRGAARAMLSPAQTLERSNDFLFAELPTETHVACSFAILDPSSGKLQGANAGPLLPSHCTGNGIEQLKANGTPLGAQLGTAYEEYETKIAPGEWVLFYNSGLPELRNAEGEQFGYVRLAEVMNQEVERGEELIEAILSAVRTFAGDISKAQSSLVMVVIERLGTEG
jgi:hypothetical protein